MSKTVVSLQPLKSTRLTETEASQAERELSSVGSERLPYKQRVGGSNPSAPTSEKLENQSLGFFRGFFVFTEKHDLLNLCRRCCRDEREWQEREPVLPARGRITKKVSKTGASRPTLKRTPIMETRKYTKKYRFGKRRCVEGGIPMPTTKICANAASPPPRICSTRYWKCLPTM